MFCRHFNKTVNCRLALPERDIFMANSTLLVSFLYAKCLHGIIPCKALGGISQKQVYNLNTCVQCRNCTWSYSGLQTWNCPIFLSIYEYISWCQPLT